MFPPHVWESWDEWREVLKGLGETLAMAFIGTVLGAVIAFPLSFVGARNINRIFVLRFTPRRVFDVIRAFETLILVLIFIRAFGLGPLAGILAIAVSEIGKGTSMKSAEMGGYSYITEHCHVVWTTIGKFCSIADATRINPGNHPIWRAVQHHAVYRSEAYGMGPDDTDFFEWRKDHWISIGHDVRIGYGSAVTAGVTIGDGPPLSPVLDADADRFRVSLHAPSRRAVSANGPVAGSRGFRRRRPNPRALSVRRRGAISP